MGIQLFVTSDSKSEPHSILDSDSDLCCFYESIQIILVALLEALFVQGISDQILPQLKLQAQFFYAEACVESDRLVTLSHARKHSVFCNFCCHQDNFD